MATIVQAGRPRWADICDSSQEQDSQPVEAPVLLHQDSYQESQSSQVCTQGGLCDQLQSKTELEDTQVQDRKAGIVRRKHLEEISDDEDGPARGQKRTVLAAPEASTPATKRQRSFPAEGSPAPTVLDPASPGQSVAPDASAMETTTTTAAETVEVVDPASPGQSAPNASAAMDTATATTMETGEMETAVVDNPTAAEGVDAADAADAPFSPDGDGEGPEAEKRLRKRFNLISMHKERPEYQAFNARFPRHRREDGQPMTPDPRAYPSKRQWETAAQKWREELRLATCGMVEFPEVV